MPYGIKGIHRKQVHIITNMDGNSLYPSIQVDGYDAWFPIETFKPYLRSMENMTEDEERELEETLQYTQFTLESYDWFNAHHIDYRGLIEKGLALEVKPEMYKIWNSDRQRR